jgi:transposase
MRDAQLYSQILGIEKPWKVTGVQVSLADDEVAGYGVSLAL